MPELLVAIAVTVCRVERLEGHRHFTFLIHHRLDVRSRMHAVLLQRPRLALLAAAPAKLPQPGATTLPLRIQPDG